MFYSCISWDDSGDVNRLDYTSAPSGARSDMYGVAILLSLAGLVVTLVATSFILIGWVGCVSLSRKMGAPQTYQLGSQTTLRLDGFVLTITHPDQQEAVIDLNLLEVKDQRYLASILHKCRLDAECSLNPRLDEEFDAELREADRFTMLI